MQTSLSTPTTSTPLCVVINSPMGKLQLEGGESGISQLLFLNKTPRLTAKSAIPQCFQECIRQLDAYFKGELQQFSLPLNPDGTAFQQKIWQLVRQIPFGKTISYKTQAQEYGNIKAIRAVASANGKNPIPIIIPCHRVIGSNGNLTGYAGGLWRKKWLLKHENALNQYHLF